MRVTLILFFGLLVLGGGGAGVYLYFQQPAEASIGETKEHKQAKDSKSGHAGTEHKFVELDPLILPIIDEYGLSQVVSIVVMIEVGDAEKAKKVEAVAPRLKDAYIQEMYGVLNKHAALKGEVIQVTMIKQKLLEISQRVMGESMIEDVLLQVVQQRKI